jgi:Uma2 family endonuclease
MTLISAASNSAANPRPKAWTRDEYHRLAESGMLSQQRTELLAGEILTMSPQRWLHASTLDRIADDLRRLIGSQAWVRTQLPIILADDSEPEPDISIVPGRREDYQDHPRDVMLVIEVSDTTLAFDRKEKLAAYAAAGIPEYWIVNLVNDQVEVYRQPASEAAESDSPVYREQLMIRPGETLLLPQPLNGVVSVTDWLD